MTLISEYIEGFAMITAIILASIITTLIVGYISGVVFFWNKGFGLFSLMSWACFLLMKMFSI